jgi:hypothetical protein
VGTCPIIIETSLLFDCVQESLTQICRRRETPRICDHRAGFASPAKLRRFICTLSAQLSALHSGNKNLGLDHTEENYAGNIRSICDRDNGRVTVIRQLDRFELARRLLSVLFIERHISKRINLGFASLRLRSELEFSLYGNPADFAIELKSLTRIHTAYYSLIQMPHPHHLLNKSLLCCIRRHFPKIGSR